MKINELISSFTIHMSNEETQIYSKIDKQTPLSLFTEREQLVIENLIRKSLISKISLNGQILVMQND
jgi:hypothetical protein